ncbi:hypothetical protein [Occallatibacter savannae]|uniref:hypothetical protein n=1 Tax=Occallatibacter savannae TaxID=1002691 RepID=UPI000D696E68|nr:hypothetical protein [Occallatibacter savannae]
MANKAVCVLTGLVLAAGISGCRIHVDKDSNGKEKNVQVDTPFGGVHVNTDQITASDLGLPVYPGAEVVKDKEHDKSADVNMGFGEWTLRVRAVNYSTTDPQDKVVEFYKKALGRYGDVITCQGNAPVGTPAKTSEGLTCADDGGGHGHVQINDKDIDGHHGLQLKAGSKRHQHILGFEDKQDGKTKFALVALDLPAGAEKAKSD